MSYFDGIAAPLLILSAILRTHLFTIFSHYNSLHYHMVTGGTVAFFFGSDCYHSMDFTPL